MSDEDFISIGDLRAERLIKRMNAKELNYPISEVIKEKVKKKLNYKENDELRLHLTIAPDEEKEVDYEILDRKYPIKEWKTECLGTKPQADKAEHFEEINQNVMRKMSFWNAHRIGTFSDFFVLESPVIPIGGSSGVHTLVTETGLVIHMLVEKKYPLRKKVLMQMLKLKLESEEDSTMALELIRFIKKILAELESEE
ncbi:hypothetical protein Tco_0739434 [Tanacetum coccineum]